MILPKGGVFVTSIRFMRREDAVYISTNWTDGNALEGYRLPGSAEETEALISQWNAGEVNGARFEMLLIEEDGVPAGLLSLYERGRDVSLGISVHPSMQKRGIASRAVGLACMRTKEQGWEGIISECRADNAASIALHRRCGFEETGRGVNRRGREVIRWRLNI